MPEIVVFAIDDALASSIALPLEMLRAARQHHVAHTRRGRSLRISLVSEQGAPVRMSGALTLLADTAAATVERAELVIIPSAIPASAPPWRAWPRAARACVPWAPEVISWQRPDCSTTGLPPRTGPFSMISPRASPRCVCSDAI